MKAERPKEIGGYRILATLGRGGMGAVYKARDADGRTVALKLLHAHLDDPEARERLRREVAALQRVRNRGIARVLDAEIESTEAFVVTELVVGKDLARTVRQRGPLPPAELATLAEQLRATLAAVHRKRVLHRDLTPANVMVTPDGPVLIDFGLAQAVEEVLETPTGLVTGTPGYVAPEVLDGAAPTAAGDWWGWAAVLTFAATGRPPFGRGAIGTVLTRVRAGKPDLKGIDEAVAEALRGGLALDPAERTKPAAVVAALEAAAEAAAAAAEVAAEVAAEETAEEATEVESGGPGAAAVAAPDETAEQAEGPADAEVADEEAGAEAEEPEGGDDGATLVLGDAHDGETGVLPLDLAAAGDAEDEGDAEEAGAEDDVGTTRVLGDAHDGVTSVLDVGPDEQIDEEAGEEVDGDLDGDLDADLDTDLDTDTEPDADLEAEDEWAEDEWAEDEWVEPDAGPARRPGTVAALALPLLALGLGRPGTALAIAVVLAVLVRSVGLDAAALQRRRARYGIRPADGAGAVLTWPWYLVRAVFGVLPVVIVGTGVVALVGGAVWWLVNGGYWVIAKTQPGHVNGFLHGNEIWVGRAYIGFVVALGLGMVWFGPMGRATREGARWALGTVAPGRVGALVAVVVGVVLAVVLAVAMLGQDVEWWPLGGPPDLG